MSSDKSVLISGVTEIAAVLGLTPSVVKNDLLGRPGFPAFRLARNWVTTRDKLTAWAALIVPDPFIPTSEDSN